jgi:hypothetical protein
MPDIMHKMFALSLGFAALIWATHHAQAQSPRPMQCGPRAEVLNVLSNTYGETRRGMGLSGPAGVVELFASRETGSWTMTVSLPDGRTCLLASGQGWESLNEDLPARVDPA